MKIGDSVVNLSSQSTTIEKHTKEERLKVWVGSSNTVNINNPEKGIELEKIEISQEALTKQATEANQVCRVNEKEICFEISDEDKQKLLAIQKMIEMLTGKKIKFYALDKITLKDNLKEPIIFVKNNNTNQQQLGWGLEYDYNESYYESHTMNFNAQGIVKTSDGREINFSLSLNMSHEFAASQYISIRAGDALKDPLVINFDGGVPKLTEDKYSFDIDCDGILDQISFIAPGSGFLALDINEDGIINDGRELFGPQTNNGFAELSKYDSDNNNWIDENDSIYEKLRIWTKDSEGNDRLFALGEKGIGAIYLGNIDTPFELKNNISNELEGKVQKTGVFLKENGQAGIIQHIDIVI